LSAARLRSEGSRGRWSKRKTHREAESRFTFATHANRGVLASLCYSDRNIGAMLNRVKIALTGLFFIILFVYATYATFRDISSPPQLSDPGWSVDPRVDRVRIRSVSPDGPASMLQSGDDIVSLNDRPITRIDQIMEFFSNTPAGASYTVEIRRGNLLIRYGLRTAPLPYAVGPMLRVALLLTPAIFLITGLVVFLLKPGDKMALLLALMFGMFAGETLTGSMAGAPVAIAAASLAAKAVSSLFWPVFFHFFLLFPDSKGSLSPILRRFPRLERNLYLPYILVGLPMTILLAAGLWSNSGPEWKPIRSALVIANVITVSAYIVGGLTSLLINYRRASRAMRRRMRVAVVGSLAGFCPILTLITIAGILNLFGIVGLGMRRESLQYLEIIAYMAFPLFPLSFAYAIVRYQVIPVRLILRRSVRYVFVSSGSVVLELIAVILALTVVLGSFFTYLKIDNSWVIGIVSGLVSIAVWNLTQSLHLSVIAPAIDRSFFREAYNTQQILSDLGIAIRNVKGVRPLLELAATKIQDALHTENVTVFMQDEATGDFRCAVSSAHTEAGSVTRADGCEGIDPLPPDSFVIERLYRSPLLTVDFDDPKSWTRALAYGDASMKQAREGEAEVLKRIGSALLLAIVVKDELLGFASLGPRLGDLPFSREDKQMLTAVAWQMAFAIQNARLIKRMAEEERLNRELEMAMEVQSRLFPAAPPETNSIELAGLCIPARGVGGDYYDFLSLANGKVGIAVADVAGKGISAALLMSTIQASLRSKADAVGVSLTDLVSSMNRLLHKSTGPSSYATFFYAEFDEQTGRLTYVNAGHNAPMLVRAGSAVPARAAAQDNLVIETNEEAVDSLVRAMSVGVGGEAAPLLIDVDAGKDSIRRLSKGGRVIGLFDGGEYEQESIQMQSGDVLIAFTDGITEAINLSGEEFGEARLRKVVLDSEHRSAQVMTEEVVKSVRAWSGDLPQQDDLTLVIMKVK